MRPIWYQPVAAATVEAAAAAAASAENEVMASSSGCAKLILNVQLRGKCRRQQQYTSDCIGAVNKDADC